MTRAPALYDRLGVVAAAYVYRLLFAVLAALGPGWLLTRASAGYGGGDADLFAPGGMLFVEGARFAGRGVAPVVVTSMAILALAGVVLGPLPFGAVAYAFSKPGRLLVNELAGAAVRRVGTLFALGAVTLIAQALAFAVVASAGAKIVELIHFDDRRHDLALVLVGLLALATAALVGAARDVASASAVTRDQGFRGAIRDALQAIQAHAGALAGAYALRAGAIFVLVAGASLALPWGRTSAALSLLVHQVAMFGVVALQASWIRRCVVAVPSAED